MEPMSRPFPGVPQPQIDSGINEDTGCQGPPDGWIPMADNVTQDGIQIHMGQQKALELGLYQTPRVEDNSNKKHQRIHAVSETQGSWADSMALPLYNAELGGRHPRPQGVCSLLTS